MVSAQDLAGELEVLPPMAPSLLRLTEIVAEGDYTVKEVEEVVRLDPGLTLDTLRFANNVANAGRSQIASVRDAVVRLGGERLFRYLYSRWLGGMIRIPLRTYGMDEKRFWDHGVVVGLVCERLALETQNDAALAFTGGLLHDIGKIVLDRLAQRLSIDIDWTSLADGSLMLAMENDIFGVNHRQIGKMLMERWHFPKGLIAVTDVSENIELAHIVDHMLVEVEQGVELNHPDGRILQMALAVRDQRDHLRQVLF